MGDGTADEGLSTEKPSFLPAPSEQCEVCKFHNSGLNGIKIIIDLLEFFVVNPILSDLAILCRLGL